MSDTTSNTDTAPISGSAGESGNVSVCTSFVARELARVQAALFVPTTAERYRHLWCVQQALSWALEPTGFAAPFDVCKGEDVGAPEELRDWHAAPAQ